MLALAISDYRRDLKEGDSTTDSEVDTYVLPEVTIPLIHIAYEKIRDRIAFVKEVFSLGFNLPLDHLDRAIEDPRRCHKLRNIDFILFEAIIQKCSQKVSSFLQNTDAKGSISYVYERQFLIEENISLFYKDFGTELVSLRLLLDSNIFINSENNCTQTKCVLEIHR